MQIVQLFRCLPYFTVIQSNKSVPFKPDAYCQKQLNMDTGKYLYFNVVVFLFFLFTYLPTSMQCKVRGKAWSNELWGSGGHRSHKVNITIGGLTVASLWNPFGWLAFLVSLYARGITYNKLYFCNCAFLCKMLQCLLSASLPVKCNIDCSLGMCRIIILISVWFKKLGSGSIRFGSRKRGLVWI